MNFCGEYDPDRLNNAWEDNTRLRAELQTEKDRHANSVRDAIAEVQRVEAEVERLRAELEARDEADFYTYRYKAAIANENLMFRVRDELCAKVERLRAEVQFQRDWCRDNFGLMPPSVEQNAAFMRALDQAGDQ